jgi:hypothetical protein
MKKIDGWDSLGARSDGHHALRSEEPHGVSPILYTTILQKTQNQPNQKMKTTLLQKEHKRGKL